MREVAQWLAHLVWDQGAAGSSPVFPTRILYYNKYIFDFIYILYYN
jgi:hypothetical protein